MNYSDVSFKIPKESESYKYDSQYVEYEYRTTWEFCQLLDRKYLNSSRRSFSDWKREAIKNKWIKD